MFKDYPYWFSITFHLLKYVLHFANITQQIFFSLSNISNAKIWSIETPDDKICKKKYSMAAECHFMRITLHFRCYVISLKCYFPFYASNKFDCGFLGNQWTFEDVGGHEWFSWFFQPFPNAFLLREPFSIWNNILTKV